MKYSYPGICVMVMLSACDFNVTNSPGPQISSSIEIAKKNGTFICEYNGQQLNSINHQIRIASVFLERRYRRKKDFFLTKDIDCCASQLVIISSHPLVNYGTGWKLTDFTRQPSSFCVVKEIAGISAPDSMQLNYVEFNEASGDTLLKPIGIYRMNAQ